MVSIGSISPNRLSCKEFLSFWIFCPYLTSKSVYVESNIGAMNISRRRSKQSKAPAIARFSMAPLLQALRFTRSTKSYISLNGPLALRSLMIADTALSPTPFTAASPKRMSPLLLTPNFSTDSLMSGPFTVIPMRLHSSITTLILSACARLRLITPAIYSAG